MKILLVWGAIIDYHRLNSLRQRTFISLNFGALKVLDQSVRVAGLLVKALLLAYSWTPVFSLVPTCG